MLLGPEALAQDDLSVPLPTPQLERSQVGLLEDVCGRPATARWRARRFGPAGATSGSFSRRTCRPEQYGEEERLLLDVAAQRLAPMLGRMARPWIARPITRLRRRASRRSWTRWPMPGRTPARRSSISRSSGARWTRCCRTITSSSCWRTQMGREPTGWASTRRGPLVRPIPRHRTRTPRSRRAVR